MEGGAGDALARGDPALLAVRGRDGLALSPVAYWFDGVSGWMTAPADGDGAVALQLDPACALWVAPRDGGEPATVAHGVARVFSLRDPLGLALHAAPLAAAVAALMVGGASSIAAHVQEAARVPSRLLPRNVVVVRVTIEDAQAVQLPAQAPGIAPALPTVVPADVRRGLAGRRRIALATDVGGRLSVAPAVWGAGFSVVPPHDVELRPGARAAAALEADGLGLALSGPIAPGPALLPSRATWWHGSTVGTADVPPPAAGTPGAVTLPD